MTISESKKQVLMKRLKTNDNRCPLCNNKIYLFKPKTFNIDHIVPKSRGGTNNVDNLQIVHTKCNHLKSNQIINQGDFVAFHKMQQNLHAKNKLKEQRRQEQANNIKKKKMKEMGK